MTQMLTSTTTTVCENHHSLQTDTSQNHSSGSTKEQPVQTQLSKKRIGPYSYRLSDVIGSGFSSTVYRGCKDNDKSQVVALKVIKTSDMKPHRRKLLENEVKILKQVEHPNIIKLLDLYYTCNNCYIITEYCEGGSLQSLIDQRLHFDWVKASYQISLACRYLAQNHIMHRDIKPANILLKNGMFKLSDFGFTYKFQNYQILKEEYTIGSPLYMPIESLVEHFYSTKSDSFALGVCIYYLVTRRFPWKGKNKQQLILNYQRKEYNRKNIDHLPPRAKHMISGLLQMNPEKRLRLTECDFELFLHIGPIPSLESQLNILKGKYSEQLKLCQYVDILFKHYHPQYFEANSYLSEYLVRHLQSLTIYYEWDSQQGLRNLKLTYPACKVQSTFGSDDYYWLNNCLKDTIRVLVDRKELADQVMLQKILRYQQVIQALIFEGADSIIYRINVLVLHSNYSALRPDSSYVKKRLSNFDFYCL